MKHAKILLPAAFAAMLLSSPADATLLKYSLSGPMEAVFYLDSHAIPTEVVLNDNTTKYTNKPTYITYMGVSGTIKAFNKTVNVFYNVSMFSPGGDQAVWGMDLYTVDYVGDLSWVTPDWYDNGFFLNGTDITSQSAEQAWFDGPLETPTLRSGIFSTKDWYGPPELLKSYTMTVSAVGSVPEPATWAFMVIGFGAVGYGLRRRKRVATLQTA